MAQFSNISLQRNSSIQPPTNEEIAERAFRIYEREGRTEGRDLDNWLKAEAELMAERQNQKEQPNAASTREAGETRSKSVPRSARRNGA